MPNYTGQVFIDNDNDGIFGAGDQAYPGLTVTVQDSNNPGINDTGVTDESGNYSIVSAADLATSIVTVTISTAYTAHGAGNPQSTGIIPNTFPFTGPMLNANGWPVPDPLGNDGTVINVE